MELERISEVIYFTIDKGDNYFGGKKGRRGGEE